MLRILFFYLFIIGFFGNVQSQVIEPIFIEGNTQGTTFHITYYDSLNRNFEQEIIQLLHEFDLSLSTYIPTSIISRINANDSNVTIDHYFEYCFNKGKELWMITDGAFDPTVYPLVQLWGFGQEKKGAISKAKIDSVLQFVGCEKVELVADKIVKKDARLSLDFNAYAQGYSVDIVSDWLLNKGISSFIVEIGGELFAKGIQEDGSNWLVGVESPSEANSDQSSLQLIVEVKNKAVATSGNYRKFIEENGKKYSHQINPISGYPSQSRLLSATVIMDDCISADAIATALIVMDIDTSIKFLNEHKDIDAYLIFSSETGELSNYETEGFRKLVIETIGQ